MKKGEYGYQWSTRIEENEAEANCGVADSDIYI